MPLVHRQLVEMSNFIDVSPSQGGLEVVGQALADRGTSGDGQEAAARHPHKCRALDRAVFHGYTFHREGIKFSAIVLYPGGTASQEPESALFVEFARIAGAMPDLDADLEFGLFISAALQITLKDMPTCNDDLSRSFGGED